MKTRVTSARRGAFGMAFVASMLAASAVGVPASARADGLRFYGLADVYAGVVRDTGTRKTFVVNSGGMSTSYWGMSGDESLGGGLSAVFAIESFMRPDVGAQGRFGTDAFFARNAYVGLAGGFGQVTLGRNTAPYFLATVFHNPFGDSFSVSPMITHTFRGNVQGDTGFSNSIRYSTKTIGGLRADLLMSAGQERTASIDPDRKAGRAFDGAVHYRGGPLSAALAYRTVNLNAGGDGHEQDAWQIGGSYDLGVARLQGQYQNSKETFTNGSPEVKRTTYQLGTSARLGAGSVLVSYARSTIEDGNAATASVRATWGLGYSLPLSKRTDLYSAAYRDSLTDPAGNRQTVGAFGMRHRF